VGEVINPSTVAYLNAKVNSLINQNHRGKRKNRNIKKSKLKIFNVNINDIRNKIVELIEIVYELDPDIVMIQKTKKCNSDKKIYINGYTIIEKLAENEINKNGL
jgi:hypothetical protein